MLQKLTIVFYAVPTTHSSISTHAIEFSLLVFAAQPHGFATKLKHILHYINKKLLMLKKMAHWKKISDTDLSCPL